MVNVWSK